MLDSDLVDIYGYSVKRLNEQIKNNVDRFPEEFRFQLTQEEYDNLRSKKLTSSYGGRRYLPYAFTELGIYMLPSVLRGKLASQQNISIIKSFKDMRHYIVENNQLLNNQDILKISTRLAKHEEDIVEINRNMATKEDIKQIMDNFINNDNIKQMVILDNQQFEANEAYKNIYKKAKHSIYIIDDYINIDTLSLLTSKRENVDVIAISDNKGNKNSKLNKLEFDNFNLEYPTLSIIRNNNTCHDRFIVLDYKKDNEKVYHCGASSKDAGKKVCCINLIIKSEMIHSTIECLLANENYCF